MMVFGKKNGKGKNNGKTNGDAAKEKASFNHLLEDSGELIVIGLLLAGELELNAFAIDRDGEVLITLKGKIRKVNEDNAKKMSEFLEQNGDMTMDDAIEGLRRRLRFDL